MICLLNFIIASKNEIYYEDLMTQWRRYMNIHPFVKSYFIIFDNERRFTKNCAYFIDEPQQTIWFRGFESGYPGIYEKTCRAFQLLFIEKQFQDIPYVLRSNLSSFFIWDRVLSFLSSSPLTGFIAGSKVFFKKTNTVYPSGCGYILSRDVAYLHSIYYHTTTKYYLPDDVITGMIAEHHTIPFTNKGFYGYEYKCSHILKNIHENVIKRIPEDVYHVRCRIGTEFERQHYETIVYMSLVNFFYHLQFSDHHVINKKGKVRTS